MKVFLKRVNEEAVIPEYKSAMAAGVDLCAQTAAHQSQIVIQPGQMVKVGTGIALDMSAVPYNIFGMVVPRSSMGAAGLVLGNTVGIIDKDYQGEIILALLNRNETQEIVINKGERVAQLIFLQPFSARFDVVDDFKSATERGAGGFGSTGK